MHKNLYFLRLNSRKRNLADILLRLLVHIGFHRRNEVKYRPRRSLFTAPGLGSQHPIEDLVEFTTEIEQILKPRVTQTYTGHGIPPFCKSPFDDLMFSGKSARDLALSVSAV